MQPNADQAGTRPRGQDGIALAMALFFVVVMAVVGFVTWQKVKNDINETTQNVKMAKSKFAAEAAAYMGLSLAYPLGGSAPVCVTHDSSGHGVARGPGACSATDLSPFERIFPKAALSVDRSSGWLSNAPTDTAEALTGSLNEKLLVKIWQPTPTTVRVVGRGTVNGITSDVQLFGQWPP